MIIRFPFWASLFTLAGIAVLLSLGWWQLERLAWKQALLAQIDTAYQSEIPTLSDYKNLTEAAPLTRIRVRGQYSHDSEMLIIPRTWEGKVGFHLVTPLEIENGGRVLVNRGWIPVNKADPDSRPETRQMGPVEITGLLRPAEKPGLFTPQNNPGTNSWYYIDPALALNPDHPASPFILYADAETGSNKLPVQEALRWEPPNDHLGYAVFWFSMAGVLLAIFYIRFIHPQLKGAVS